MHWSDVTAYLSVCLSVRIFYFSSVRTREKPLVLHKNRQNSKLSSDKHVKKEEEKEEEEEESKEEEEEEEEEEDADEGEGEDEEEEKINSY